MTQRSAPPPHVIELATSTDIPAITAIANRAAQVGVANFATKPEPISEWMLGFESQSSRYPWLVARHEGRVLGFAKAGPHRARGAYQWTAETTIYLDEAAQAQGLGSALYARLLPLLDAQGYVTLLAGITVGQLASERLHARFGFVRCAHFHRLGWKHGAWHDVAYWERALRDSAGPPPTLRSVADVWSAASAPGAPG
jgi:phosphinothricin acetyltransferase